MKLSLGEIAATLGASLPGWQDQIAAGYSIDSRTIRPGELFFAVRGPRFDGHNFVREAFDVGACGAIIAAERLERFPDVLRSKLMAVSNPPDPAVALQRLGAHVRRKWGGPLVAVTGSAGKTTTRQFISTLLGTRFRVQQNEGNLNNQLGLPLSLLKIEPQHQIGVFELGMSAPGEIRFLASLARPDVAVVTNVGEAHLEFFPSVDAIAEAKFELIDVLDARGWAVLNADDVRVAGFGPRARSNVLYYGTNPDANVKAREIKPREGGGYRFRIPIAPMKDIPSGAAWQGRPGALATPGKPRDAVFHLALSGRHHISNVLAAAAVCHLFGIAPETLETAVNQLKPPPMRGQVVALADGARVVLDCYNSSPGALTAMLEAVAEMPAERRFAVLGGMKELGESSGALHVACGVRVAELQYTGLLAVGAEAGPLTDGARAGGMAAEAIEQLATPEEAGERLAELLRSGDVALLKASRAVALEKAWERLRELRPSDGP